MSDAKSSNSGAESYEAIGEYWDNHDLTEHWDATRPAEFTVDVQLQTTYFAVESSLSERLRASAAQRGISAETLLNLWLQDRMTQETVREGHASV